MPRPKKRAAPPSAVVYARVPPAMARRLDDIAAVIAGELHMPRFGRSDVMRRALDEFVERYDATEAAK